MRLLQAIALLCRHGSQDAKHQVGASRRHSSRGMARLPSFPNEKRLTSRGHLRPHLHLYLNLLCVHPQLRITVFIQPSSQKNIEKELSSVALQHLHQPTSTVPASSGTALERLQLIVVTSHAASVLIDFTPEEMVNEAVDFAKVLPDFLKGVFAGEANIGPERVAHNKFAEAPVSFIMYDVSSPGAHDTRGVTLTSSCYRISSRMSSKAFGQPWDSASFQWSPLSPATQQPLGSEPFSPYRVCMRSGSWKLFRPWGPCRHHGNQSQGCDRSGDICPRRL